MEENNNTNSNTEKNDIKTDSVNIETVSSELVDTMPEPSSAIDNAVSNDSSTGENNHPIQGKTDKHGRTFNKQIHKVDSNDKPIINKKDGYIAIIGGRRKMSNAKPKNVNKKPLNMPAGSIVEDPAIVNDRASIALAGRSATALTLQIGILLGGDEWYPLKDEKTGLDEARALDTAYIDYFTAKNITDFPPGVALSIALIGYIVPRFTMPKTKEKSRRFLGRVIGWWKNRKNKKENKKRAEEIRKEKEKKSE